jgi:hypothetical protein
MAILILEAVGPKAEELADEASKATEIPVGHDPDFDSFTFDSDEYADEELQGIVFDALAGADPAWREHLSLSD